MQTNLLHYFHSNLPIKAGSRIIKTSVAVTLAYLVTQLLHTSTPIHAVGAVIITMQPTIYETVSTSKIRLLGTIIGMFIGSFFLFFIPVNALTMGLGIFVTLTICTKYGWGAACGISCFVFTALFINVNASIMDGFYRLTDTGIGILSSLLVNFLVPNRSFSQTLDQQLIDIKENLMRYLLACMESYITLEHKDTLQYLQKDLQITFESAKEKYHKYESECKYRHYSYGKLNEYHSMYHNLWSIYILINQIHLDVISGQSVHTNLHAIFSECVVELRDLYILIDKEDHSIRRDIEFKLNYLLTLLQTDLLDIEKIGIDEYELSRHEKREVANKLYLLDRILRLIKAII